MRRLAAGGFKTAPVGEPAGTLPEVRSPRRGAMEDWGRRSFVVKRGGSPGTPTVDRGDAAMSSALGRTRSAHGNDCPALALRGALGEANDP